MRRTEFITNPADFKKLTAAQLMETEVKTFLPDVSWEEMAEAMTKGNYGSVPIVDEDNKLLGIVSEHNLLKSLMDGKDITKIKAGDIMTKQPVVVAENTQAGEIVELLEKYHFIRIPVAKDQKLVGVVARRDILFGYLRATAKPPLWL